MSKNNKRRVKTNFPEWWYRKVLNYAEQLDWIHEGDIIIYEHTVFTSQSWVMREKRYIKKLFMLGHKPKDVIKMFDKAQEVNYEDDQDTYCDFANIYQQGLEKLNK